MNRIKSFILGGIRVENYSHVFNSDGCKVDISLYIHWKYRLSRTVNSTRYVSTFYFREVDWFVTEWEELKFTKDDVFDDPLPKVLTGRAFQGQQNYLYFELDKL